MGEVIGAGELHKGVKLLIDGEPWEITEFSFSKPGKGQAIYNCKLRNMMTGGGCTKSYRSGDKFEKPELVQMSVTYSYDDGTAFVFTDENFARPARSPSPRPSRAATSARSRCSSTRAM